jgi:hypothetical protein
MSLTPLGIELARQGFRASARSVEWQLRGRVSPAVAKKETVTEAPRSHWKRQASPVTARARGERQTGIDRRGTPAAAGGYIVVVVAPKPSARSLS